MSQSLLPSLAAPIKRSFYHAWVPSSNETHNQFILDVIRRSKDTNQPLPPIVVAFDKALTQDQKDLFAQALQQVNNYYQKWADPKTIVTSYADFLGLLGVIVQSTPRFYRVNINGVTVGEPVGVPLYLILDLISNTSAAYTLFDDKTFNTALKNLLNGWKEYLDSDASGAGLVEWFSQEGLALLESGLGKYTFDQTFAVDPNVPEGQRYRSWDSFFVRRFKDPSLRPILQPPSGSEIFYLYNASESTVFRTTTNARAHDTFWLKTQEYSLYDILSDRYNKDTSLADKYASRLEGSSAYQAFLSPADYHRWNSPLKGQVTINKVIDGTYYAVLPDSGAPEYDPDLLPGDPHGAIIRSQPWLSVAATRAVFIIEPDPKDPNPLFDIALLVQIGMVEVSSCDINEKFKGKTDVPVSVGDELGMFHFGGSSYTLFVKTNANYRLVYQDTINSPIRPGQHRWINSVVGQFWPVKKN